MQCARAEGFKLGAPAEPIIYGYVASEDLCGRINPLDESATIFVRQPRRTPPAPVAFLWEARARIEGGDMARPMPDPRSVVNHVCALSHRLLGALPPSDPVHTERFLCYAGHVIRSWFRLLGVLHEDSSWRNYAETGGRARHFYDNLERSIELLRVVSSRGFEKKCFIKCESYAVDADGRTKYPRTIAGGTPEHVALCGPIFRTIDELTFGCGLPFAKHIPVRDRLQVLDSRFGAGRVQVTDYSSFECHSRLHVCAAQILWVEAIGLFRGSAQLRQAFGHAFGPDSVSKFVFGSCTGYVGQTLASGDPWTSSANGVANLLITSYLRLATDHPTERPEELAERFGEVRILIEGDDGITAGGPFDRRLIAGLGIKLKCVEHETYRTSGFCGTFCPPHSDVSIADSTKFLSGFFQLPWKYHALRIGKIAGLVRAKSLSYYYQYGSDPIVGPLCYAVLRRTRGTAIWWDEADTWGRTVLQEAVQSGQFYDSPPNIPDDARIFVSEQFGYDIAWQESFAEACEAYAQGRDVTFPHHPNLTRYQRWYERYSAGFGGDDDDTIFCRFACGDRFATLNDGAPFLIKDRARNESPKHAENKRRFGRKFCEFPFTNEFGLP